MRERSKPHASISLSITDRISTISSFSSSHLEHPGVQKTRDAIIQHSLYLNYDVNHHFIFASLTSLQISQTAKMGLVIIIRTPVLAKPGLIFPGARRVRARTQRLFYTTPHHFPAMRVGAPSRWHGMVWSGTVRGPTQRALVCESSVIALLVLLFIFLFHLLFPVNCPYLNLWSLPFVPPILLSRAMQGER